MKNPRTVTLFILLAIGVFGDGVIAEVVSVKEGDYVILHSDVTGIQRDEMIEWRFNQIRIAKIDYYTDNIAVWVKTDGSFSDRLQLDNQTGDLKIRNIKTTDEGEYKIQITSVRGSPVRTITVKVSADEQKTVSAMKRDSVSLNTVFTETQIYVLQWKLEHQNTIADPIAKINRTAGISSTSDGPDGRFRGRLQLDYLTGSLTIRNINTSDSGLYKVEISSSSYTIHRSFSVTVRDEVKPESQTEGSSVFLQTAVTEIPRDDSMWWMFDDTLIAEINVMADRFTVFDDVLDGRFRDRLKLNHQTGSLTIMNITTKDSGLYELQISGSRHNIHRRFTVIVRDSRLSAGAKAGIVVVAVVAVIAIFVAIAAFAAFVLRHKQITLFKKIIKMKSLSVMEGETAHLETGVTEVKRSDVILWMFGDQATPLAQMGGFTGEVSICDDVLDGRFRGRLQLNKQTGDLIIMKVTTEHAGVYQLQMMKGNHYSGVLFTVTVVANSGNVSEEMHMLQDGETDGIVIQDK